MGHIERVLRYQRNKVANGLCRCCTRSKLPDISLCEEHKTKAKYDNIRRVYGLSREDYDNLISTGCRICGAVLRKPHIDHDHLTGRVRGVLCNKCNTGLGHFNDSVEMLELAIQYLKG